MKDLQDVCKHILPFATEAEADLLGVALLFGGGRVGLDVFGHDVLLRVVCREVVCELLTVLVFVIKYGGEAVIGGARD